jgi:hypothetical protein
MSSQPSPSHRLANLGAAAALTLAAVAVPPVAQASSLQVTGTAAHCGSFGLLVQADDVDTAFVGDNSPLGENRYVVRFWADFTYVVAWGGSPATIFQAFTADNGGGSEVFNVTAQAGTNPGTTRVTVNPNGGAAVSVDNLAAGWHSFEIDWTNSGTQDNLVLKVDDAALPAGDVTTALTVESVRWGILNQVTNINGLIRFDDFVSRRTSNIGAGTACTGALGTPWGGPFYTVTPCRILDTRQPSGAPILQSGTNRNLNIAGVCGLPADATEITAVAVNVTAIEPTANGNVRIQPTGVTTNTSTINFVPGLNRANNAIVQPNAAGSITLVPFVAGPPGGTLHFLIDVTGYFGPEP